MSVVQWKPDHYQAVTLTEVKAMNVPKYKPFDVAMIQEVLEQVTYKAGWELNFVNAETPYIQVSCADAVCAVSGEPAPYRGAKHYLSKWMCRQELVGKAYGAIRDAEEHEMRENFRYRGRSIYNPHIDPDVLVDVMEAVGADIFSLREDSMMLSESE